MPLATNCPLAPLQYVLKEVELDSRNPQAKSQAIAFVHTRFSRARCDLEQQARGSKESASNTFILNPAGPPLASQALAEIRFMKQLEHPNIIRYYEYFEDEGKLLIIMQ